MTTQGEKPTMKRKQIYITKKLDQLLHQWSVVKGVPEAALVREALGEYFKRLGKEDNLDSQTNPLLRIVGMVEANTPADAASDHDRYLYGKDKI